MSTDTTQRDAIESALRQLLPLFNLDELRVLEFDALRLLKGRETYGPLDLSAPRDWNHAEFEELVDARLYRTFAIIQAQDAQRAQLHADVAAEIAAAVPIAKAPTASPRMLAAIRELRDASPLSIFESTPFEECWDTSDAETEIVDTDITGEVAKR